MEWRTGDLIRKGKQGDVRKELDWSYVRDLPNRDIVQTCEELCTTCDVERQDFQGGVHW